MKKNVLITGATGNLGKAVVQRFLKDGYRVIFTTVPGEESPFENHDDLVSWEADLQNESNAADVIRQVVTRFERLDAALLLVGGFAAGGIDATDGAAIKKMFALNFETAFFVAKPVFQSMIQTKTPGRIILIGARPALYPNEGKDYLAYALSKSLLFKFAEFLNAEGKAHNIVTSVIVPGTIDTPANRKSMPDANFDKWVAPQEIARAMAFLCNDENRSIREPVLKFFGKS